MANDVKKEYVSILAQINVDGTIQPLCVLLEDALLSAMSILRRGSATDQLHPQKQVCLRGMSTKNESVVKYGIVF